MLADIEIAHRAKLKPIEEIAEKIGIDSDDLECYGHYKAKVSLKFTKEVKNRPQGKTDSGYRHFSYPGR